MPTLPRDINAALDVVEKEEGVSVLLAVESGSRAWGFPSPDSDWDVRFIYARPASAYLKVFPHRDVIERPLLPGDIDLSGWDLRKALSLMLSGNCTIREWLASPIVYQIRADFMDRLEAVALAAPDRVSALHHYRSLAQQVRRRWLQRRPVSMKKYLYALRPALALEWLRKNPEGMPPMDMPALLASAGLHPPDYMAVFKLLQMKRDLPELGEGDPDPMLDALIDGAIAWATEQGRDTQKPASSLEAIALADDLMQYGARLAGV